MILEIADFRIPPGQQAAFEAAVQAGMKTVLSQAEGFIGCQVQQSIESPERYVLTVQWESLEAHTVGFRGGPLFPKWREFIQPFFAAPPVVEHFRRFGEVAAG
jgi:heme-degrading monooxygenase HmoA